MMSLLLPLACVGDPTADDPAAAALGVADLVVEPDADIPTLLHVSWTTALPTRARVAWRTDEDSGTTALGEEGTTHEVDLFGLYAGATAELELVHVGADGEELTVAGESVTIEDAPSWLPPIVVNVSAGEAPISPYLSVVAMDMETQESSFQIVDWHGHPVWWRPVGAELNPFARRTADGRGFFYTAFAPDMGVERVFRMDWRGETTEIGGDRAHHEVHERADGSVGVCRSVPYNVAGRSAWIDVLTVVGADGLGRDVWSSADLYDPEASNRCDGLVLGDGGVDATHCNGVTYDEQAEQWILSLYCQGSIVAVDDATGEEAWILGGPAATIADGEGAAVSLSHSVRYADGTLWAFDNGSVSAGSRIVALDVDPARGTSELLGEWRGPATDYTPVLGSLQLLPDGVLGAFGVSRTAYVFGPDGDVRVNIAVDGAYVLGAVEAMEAPTL